MRPASPACCLLANCLFPMLQPLHQQSQASGPSSRRDAVMCPPAPPPPALTRWDTGICRAKMVSRLSGSCQASVCCFRTCRHCPKWVRGMGRPDAPGLPCDAMRPDCLPRGIDFPMFRHSQSRAPQGNQWMAGQSTGFPASRLLETDGGRRMIARHHRMVREQQQFLTRGFVKCYFRSFLDIICDWSYPQT